MSRPLFEAVFRRPGAAAGMIALLLALPARVACGDAGTTRVHPTLIDAFGDTLPAGPCPQRIVSLSPNVTEILFALGVDSNRIVGVTRFCDFPPEARRRPVVGGIVDPALEVVVSQRPDLVLAVRGNPRPMLGQLARLGLPVFAIDDRTGLRGVAEMMATVATLSCPDDAPDADSLVAWYSGALAAFESWAAAIPPAARPSVYYADPEALTWTAGAGSHIDDLIRLAGGVNAAGELPGWPQVSVEWLVTDQPRFLILALPVGCNTEEVYQSLLGRPGWSALAALRNRRICWVSAAPLQRPGPRLIGVLAELAACLHPERTAPPAPGPPGPLGPGRAGGSR